MALHRHVKLIKKQHCEAQDNSDLGFAEGLTPQAGRSPVRLLQVLHLTAELPHQELPSRCELQSSS